MYSLQSQGGQHQQARLFCMFVTRHYLRHVSNLGENTEQYALLQAGGCDGKPTDKQSVFGGKPHSWG